jgi:hypothetical protein
MQLRAATFCMCSAGGALALSPDAFANVDSQVHNDEYKYPFCRAIKLLLHLFGPSDEEPPFVSLSFASATGTTFAQLAPASALNILFMQQI